MKKYILLISAIIAIGLTTYLSLLPLNWVSQADISNMYDTPITPAGFTFSIWSLIYLSWFALGAYALIKKPKISKKLRYKLAAAQLLSMMWLIPWHFQYIFVSFIVMSGIFIILWKTMQAKKWTNKYFNWVVSLFFGWIAVAALLNANTVLIANGLYTYPIIFSGISIGLAAGISTYWVYKKQNYIPLLVLIWALIGIYMK